MASKNSAWKKLKSDLKIGNIARLYLFYGEESYLREFYTREIVKKIVGDSLPEFNFVEFHGIVPINSLIEAVDAYPVMSEKKLVLIHNYDIFKENETTKKQLIELISDLPEHCYIVFTFSSVIKMDKRTKLYSEINRVGEIVEFQRAEQEDLIPWIKRRFREYDRSISTELCKYLIFYCGELMQSLIPEIEKIASYSRRQEVQRKDIDVVAAPNPEAIIFDLTDAITAQQYDKSLAILEKLDALGENPILLFALIGRQMRQIYSACLVRQAGQNIALLMRMWGMRSEYPAKIIMRAAQGVTLSWARFAVILCAEVDGRLKRGGSADDLKYFIARLAAYKGELA